jgi:hypothetical protein
MKVIFIFLFALFSLTKSAEVYELELNTEYKVDVKKYKEGYIPSGTVSYFKVPVEEGVVTIEFQLKLLREKIRHLFKVFACVYAEEPTEDEIINKKDKEDYQNLLYDNIYQEGILDIYKYSISIGDNVKYVSFLVYNGDNIDNLSVQADGFIQLKYKIYDINYMKELELKKDILEEHKGIFVFRLENDNRNINYIKFKTTKKTSEIFAAVTGYKDKPYYVLDFSNATFKQELTLNSVTNDEEYYIYEYEYNYEKVDDTAYLCVFFMINEKIDYLSVLVGDNSN